VIRPVLRKSNSTAQNKTEDGEAGRKQGARSVRRRAGDGDKTHGVWMNGTFQLLSSTQYFLPAAYKHRLRGQTHLILNPDHPFAYM
jgi:hypothetical protein